MGLVALSTKGAEYVVRKELTNFSAARVEDWLAGTAVVLQFPEFLPRAVLIEVADVPFEVARIVRASAFCLFRAFTVAFGGLYRCRGEIRGHAAEFILYVLCAHSLDGLHFVCQLFHRVS